MNNRELKQFHSENKTHVTKREFSGAEISVDNAVNAPMDLKIFGNSYQKVMEQGKNLFDKNKYSYTLGYYNDNGVYTSSSNNLTAYTDNYCEVSENTTYYISPLGGCLSGGKYAIYFYNKDKEWLSRLSWATDDESMIYGGLITTPKDCYYVRFQIFLGAGWISGFDAETFQFFVPATPSADYPSEIYPSSEILLKCTDGKKVNSTKIPLVGSAMEVSDFAKSNLTVDGKYYLADYIEYNSATDKAYRYKFIDDTLLDYTLPLKDQTQAILEEPTVEELTPTETEYIFKNVKSIQDGCVLSTETYSTDGLPYPNPMHMEAKIKLLGTGKKESETKITYEALSSYTYDELYEGIPHGEEN